MLGLIPAAVSGFDIPVFKRREPKPGLALCLVQGSLLFFNVDCCRGRRRASRSLR